MHRRVNKPTAWIRAYPAYIIIIIIIIIMVN